MCMMLAGALGAVASLAQGVMGMQAAKHNAKLAEREAQRIRQLGAVQEAADRRKTEYALGQQRVDLAAAGRSISTGSPLQLAFNSKLEAELDHLATRAGYQMRGEAKDAEASQYRLQGKQALFGGFLSAAGRILNSVPTGNPALS